MYTIMAIDKNIEVYTEQTAVWAQHGVSVFRVDTVHDAILMLASGGDYLFISINEDSNPDFLVLLPVLRDVSTCPIFVITSNYTPIKKIEAIRCGADVYDPFSAYAVDNVNGAFELLGLIKRQTDRPANKASVLVGGGIILSPLRRNVYVQSIEVFLTKKEFDILFYLISNRSILLSYDQIAYYIWGNDYYRTTADVIRAHVKRLRTKLVAASPSCRSLIENKYSQGYRFTA